MWRGGGRGTQGEWGPAVCHGQCWAGGEGSPTAAPYWHFVSWGSVPPPALQAEHQAGTQPAVPGGAVPTGCEIHSISSDLNRDSTQQDPHWECPFSSGPSPFHLPLSLGVPGAFHLSLFSPGSVYGCFCTGSVVFFSWGCGDSKHSGWNVCILCPTGQAENKPSANCWVGGGGFPSPKRLSVCLSPELLCLLPSLPPFCPI